MINNWTFISLLFGILYISFIIWNRLIRVRLPKELIFINEYDLTFFIILFLTILFGILFIYYILNLIKYLPKEPGIIIRKIMKIEEKLKKYKIYVIMEQIIKAFIEGPLYLYLLIYNQTRKIHNATEIIGRYLFFLFYQRKVLTYLFYIGLIVLPQLVVSFIFFIEVVYFKQLNIFYKVLPLLIIPLTIKAYFGILKFHTESVIKSYEKYFKFYFDEETGILHITIKYLTDPNEISKQEAFLKREKENPKYLQNIWNFYYNMLLELYQIFIINLYDAYKTKLFSIYYMLFFVGFFVYFLILIGIY
jgi:hypothetical protein